MSWSYGVEDAKSGVRVLVPPVHIVNTYIPCLRNPGLRLELSRRPFVYLAHQVHFPDLKTKPEQMLSGISSQTSAQHFLETWSP